MTSLLEGGFYLVLLDLSPIGYEAAAPSHRRGDQKPIITQADGIVGEISTTDVSEVVAREHERLAKVIVAES